MLRTSQGDLRIHQITITSDSPIVDKPLSEAGLRDRYDLLVLGARSTTGEMAFNPSPRQNLAPGTTLIVMGDVDDIARAQKALATTEASG
jgi:voltage-gated potassium channel